MLVLGIAHCWPNASMPYGEDDGGDVRIGEAGQALRAPGAPTWSRAYPPWAGTLRWAVTRQPFLALFAMLGCGRVGFDRYPAEDASVPIDVFDPLVVVPVPFGPPRPIPMLQDPTNDDDDPSATGDMLELYYVVQPGGSGVRDIYVSRRSAIDQPWGPSFPVTELNTAADEASPEVAADGLTL